MRPIPDFAIIGGQKCGTSAIYHALTTHPAVDRSEKEKKYFSMRWDMGAEAYRDLFRDTSLLCGDASPSYLYHGETAAIRLRDSNPEVRIIALFRDPVARAVSEYVGHCREPVSFAEALALEQNKVRGHGYLMRGRYAEYLEQWLQVFDRAQFVFVVSEEFRDAQEPTLDPIQEFIGLPPTPITPEQRFHSPPPIPDGIGEYLRAYFRPHSARLAELLGRALPWPS